MNFTIEVHEVPRRSDSLEYVIKLGSIQKVARVSGAMLLNKDSKQEIAYQIKRRVKEAITDYFGG